MNSCKNLERGNIEIPKGDQESKLLIFQVSNHSVRLQKS